MTSFILNLMNVRSSKNCIQNYCINKVSFVINLRKNKGCNPCTNLLNIYWLRKQNNELQSHRVSIYTINDKRVEINHNRHQKDKLYEK